jgi:hypothetical protein
MEIRKIRRRTSGMHASLKKGRIPPIAFRSNTGHTGPGKGCGRAKSDPRVIKCSQESSLLSRDELWDPGKKNVPPIGLIMQ